ncbi:MAG: phosphotransferase [Proteobacteria bacterium]|nr:phosphotransferase [Pseudomonadota bacterium]
MVVARPNLSPAMVAALVHRHYGLAGEAKPLSGERDTNFHFVARDGAQFVFKAACAASAGEPTDLPDGTLFHIQRTDPGIPAPRVRCSDAGDRRIAFRDAADRPSEAILCTFMRGVPLMSVPRTASQRRQCGHWLARIGRALRNYDHPSCHQRLVWDVRNFAEVRRLLEQLGAVPRRGQLEAFMDDFSQQVAPVLEGVRRQVVHDDLNARNVIVDERDPSRVVGIIDFGDAVHTALVGDVAIGAVGQVSTPVDAIEAMGEFVTAYQEIQPLGTDELAILGRLVAARLVTNYVVVSLLRANSPGDGHFSDFDAAYFEWRLDLAMQLAKHPRRVPWAP